MILDTHRLWHMLGQVGQAGECHWHRASYCERTKSPAQDPEVSLSVSLPADGTHTLVVLLLQQG